MILLWFVLLLTEEVRFDAGTVIVPACPSDVYFEDAKQPLLGDCENGRFTPRFPLLPGRRYRVGSTTFTVPHSEAAVAKVEKVYPSGSDLPANLLRLYIHFTDSVHYDPEITLETEAGVPVEQAFLEMPEGLWNPARTRLTVFLHPGRIKRGLRLNERLGPPLLSGTRYQLKVNGTIVKRFRAIDAIRSLPRLQIHATASVIEVTSDRPLDRALMDRTLRITDSAGAAIRGSAAEINQEETSWRFTPQNTLQSGTYVLYAAAELEDIAGNRLTRLFDEESSAEARPIRLSFRID